MLRRIELLNNLIVRSYSVKLTQFELKKISRSDRLKNHFSESKYMFGAKIKKTKKQLMRESDETAKPLVELKSDKDISSEIYWTCLHVPEIQNFTRPTKTIKRKSKPVDAKTIDAKAKLARSTTQQPSKDSDLRARINAAPKTNYKAKKEQKEEVEKRLSPREFDLPSKEVTYVIKSRDIMQELPMKMSHGHGTSPIGPTLIVSEDNSVLIESPIDGRAIPFATHQLRSIPSFPMYLTNESVISQFESFVDKPPTFSLPSVSKVLQATMPEAQRNALIKWKNEKIAELGLEGFKAMQQSHFDRGTQFHQCVQNHFEGQAVVKSDLKPEILDIWKSIEPLLHKFQAPGVLIEQKLKHPFLLYHGIVDCVSVYNSSLCVIEWKKSDRHKKTIERTYDAPIQLASYLGALNASRPEFRGTPIKHGVVVVAYHDGLGADIFEVNEEELGQYWRQWLNRVQEYWVRFKDNTLLEPI